MFWGGGGQQLGARAPPGQGALLGGAVVSVGPGCDDGVRGGGPSGLKVS